MATKKKKPAIKSPARKKKLVARAKSAAKHAKAATATRKKVKAKGAAKAKMRKDETKPARRIKAQPSDKSEQVRIAGKSTLGKGLPRKVRKGNAQRLVKHGVKRDNAMTDALEARKKNKAKRKKKAGKTKKVVR